MAMLTRGISFRRQGSSGMSWADNWTFTDAGMFRAPKAADLEPEKAVAAAAEVPTSQKTEPIQVQPTTSYKPHRRGIWGIRWIKSRFKKSKG